MLTSNSCDQGLIEMLVCLFGYLVLTMHTPGYDDVEYRKLRPWEMELLGNWPLLQRNMI